MDGVIILLIIAVAVYIFSSSDEKNSPAEFKPAPPEPKKFVRVIFKKNDVKTYDYFLGDNFDVKVGDFVEVFATSVFSGKDELKTVKVVYISKAGEISYKATKTVLRKAAYPKW